MEGDRLAGGLTGVEIDRLMRISVPVVSDVLDEMGLRNQVMQPGIRPVSPDLKACGNAFTMRMTTSTPASIRPGDLPVLAPLDAMKSDDIAVLTTCGDLGAAAWGELMSTAAKARGVRGVIVDGPIRDVPAILAMRFPAFARCYTPADSKGRMDLVDFGKPIMCGRVMVRPGDVVFADLDGVVVIPIEKAEEVLLEAEKVHRVEDDVRESLRRGESAVEVFKRFKKF
jgi:4-hydroxy-4-methyl-2-oxoglutarate aldolase